MKELLRTLAYICLREKLQKGSFYPLPARILINRKLQKMQHSLALPLPLIANIETTNFCNANCTYCYYTKMKRSHLLMDMGLYQKIIDECSSLGIREVRLNVYGEPLLDEFLCQRIVYAKEKGIARVGLFTNASLLNAEKTNALLACRLDEICISLDGATKEAYENIRRGLSYNEVLGNLERLLRIRSKRFKVHLFFAAGAQNQKEIGPFKRKWRGKVDSINIGSCYKTDLYDVERKNFAPCPYLWKRIVILSNGDVVLCCQDYEGYSVIGNMKSSTIRQIWSGKTLAQYRRLHLAKASSNIDACNRCELNLWIRWLVPFRF